MSVSLYGSGQTVVQTVSFILPTTFSDSSGNFVNTGITASITPLSSSNKILVLYNVMTDPSGGAVFFQVQRGGTPIGVGNAGTGQRQVSGSSPNNTNSNALINISNVFLDSPATTSSITYSVYGASQSSGSTMYINYSSGDSGNTAFGRGASTITLMEIAYV